MATLFERLQYSDQTVVVLDAPPFVQAPLGVLNLLGGSLRPTEDVVPLAVLTRPDGSRGERPFLLLIGESVERMRRRQRQNDRESGLPQRFRQHDGNCSMLSRLGLFRDRLRISRLAANQSEPRL